MSAYTHIQIPKPQDPQTFERGMAVLWRCILKDPNVQLYGRSGQSQNGVDLIGCRNRDPECLVGVQCKLRTERRLLSESEIRREVENALAFRPPLSEYHIVTTAPTDTRLQALAKQLQCEVMTKHERNIAIVIWGWNSLQDEICRYREAVNAFTPFHATYGNNLNETPLTIQGHAEQVGTTRPLPDLASNNDVAATKFAVATADIAHQIRDIHDEQITSHAELLDTMPNLAMKRLIELKNKLGEDIDDRLRFRIESNIAACKLKLGDSETAARSFIEAYDLDPLNPKAVFNKAYGFFLQGNMRKVIQWAERHISSHPDSAPLASIYIEAAISDETIADPLTHIPPSLRTHSSVMKANTRWQRERGSPSVWRDLAANAYDEHPDDDGIQELYANALLDEAIQESNGAAVAFRRRTDYENVVKARDIYDDMWSRAVTSRQYMDKEPPSFLLNFLVALVISREFDRVIELGETALRYFPHNTQIRRHMAIAWIENGNPDRANDILSQMPCTSDTVDVRLHLAIAENRWDRAAGIIDNHREKFPARAAQLLDAVLARAKIEIADKGDVSSLLNAYRQTFSENVRGAVMLAEYARQRGFDDISKSYYDLARAALTMGNDHLDARLHLANEALARGDARIAADILKDRFAICRDDPEVRLLATALAADFPARERAAKFFEQLDENIRRLSFYRGLEGVLRFNMGALDIAARCFEEAYETIPRLEYLLPLIKVRWRLGDKASIHNLLENVDLDAAFESPIRRMQFAHVLKEFLRPQQAVEVAYDAVVDGIDSSDVVNRFLVLVLQIVVLGKSEVDLDVAVGDGVWVRLESNDGRIQEMMVGEDKDRAWGQRIDINNPFVSAFVGYRKGDSFEYPDRVGGKPRKWTVAATAPRWLRAFRHISEEIEERFPDHAGFAILREVDKDPEPIFKAIRERADEGRERADLYLRHGIPIAFAAGQGFGSRIEFAEYIASMRMDVRVCIGTAKERDAVVALVERYGSGGAVVDGLTAWIAAELLPEGRMFHVMREIVGPVSIPTTEVEHLRSLLDSWCMRRGQDMETLSYEEGQYVYRKTGSDEVDNRIRSIRYRLSMVEEGCDSEPLVIPDNLPEAGEQLRGLPQWEAVVPAVLAGDKRLLICEDMAMRHLAERDFGTRGIWLQSLLFVAHRRQLVSLDEYADAVLKLATRRFVHIWVDQDVLLSIYRRDIWPGLERLSVICRYLGTEDAEAKSHIDVAAGFLWNIWTDIRYAGIKREKATSIVLRALLLRRKGREFRRWLEILIPQLPRAARRYYNEWVKGHFLQSSVGEGADPSKKGSVSGAAGETGKEECEEVAV